MPCTMKMMWVNLSALPENGRRSLRNGALAETSKRKVGNVIEGAQCQNGKTAKTAKQSKRTGRPELPPGLCNNDNNNDNNNNNNNIVSGKKRKGRPY